MWVISVATMASRGSTQESFDREAPVIFGRLRIEKMFFFFGLLKISVTFSGHSKMCLSLLPTRSCTLSLRL